MHGGAPRDEARLLGDALGGAVFPAPVRSCTRAAPSSADAQRESRGASRDAAPRASRLTQYPSCTLPSATPTDRPEQLLHPRIDDRRDALGVAEERTRPHRCTARARSSSAGSPDPGRPRQVPGGPPPRAVAARPRRPRASRREVGVVRADRSRSASRTSPTVAWAASASRIGTSRFESPSAACRTCSEAPRSGVPLGPDAPRPLDLAPLGLGVEAVELHPPRRPRRSG